LLQADVEYLEAMAIELWQRANGEGCKLNRSILKTAPIALQRRVMRQFLRSILPTEPSFEHIEKLVALIAAPNRSQTDPFPGGAIAQVEAEWIVLKALREMEDS
jgi:tRNA(Ile)-lysidine synthase